jgi:beta-mannosidase
MHLAIFAPNAQLVDAVEVDLAVPARSAQTHSVNTVLGRFNDTNNAYGFGPPAVDVLSASLVDTDGVQRARTVHFALGQRRPIEAGLELRAETGADAAGQFVLVSTGRAAQWVALDLRHGVAHDSWFHLAPGQTRRINIDGADGEPLRGTVRALNAATEVSITQLP